MRKILAVATNSNAINRVGKQTGLWLSELTHFIDVVTKAGFEVEIASPLGGEIPIDESRHSIGKQMKDSVNNMLMSTPKFRQSLKSSVSVESINVSEYEAIYLAGGHGAAFDFRQSEALQLKLSEFYSAKKLLSGVCHGVAGFIDTKDAFGNIIVRNKKITGFSNFEDKLAEWAEYLPFLLESELKNVGAIYRKNIIPFTSRVEIDANLITGQNPSSVKAVGKAVVRMLQKSCRYERV